MATFVVALDPSIEGITMFITISRPKKISSSHGLIRASLVLSAFFALTFSGRAQTLEPNFSDVLVMSGWSQPVGATFDANGRLYVWEKSGKVWIVQNGVRLATPLIDISEEVGNWRDHGCLGFVLDPNFLTNGHIYLMYLVDRHHLMNFGTPAYNAATNEYFAASIMRITRYTATGPTFNTVNYNSRLVLVGETRKTGIALTHESHSTGSLVFGSDGTLIATVGDAASYNNVDVGSDGGTYYAQCLVDSILRPQENVGAMRAQMVTCLNGKVLRLDPNTGDGVQSNPWYLPGQPRAPQSRVWALGLRNPYRMTIKPNSGSTDPADADPGTLYIGDVGWYTWEDLNVCNEPGMNFGWPLFEGIDVNVPYTDAVTRNLDAPNPNYDGVTCTEEFYAFQDLTKQATPQHVGGHPDPCNPALQIPATVPHHFHSRPAVDWLHGNQSRVPEFVGNTSVAYDLDDPQSPVPGPRFGGNAAIGGPFMSGLNMPAGYQNSTFQGDFAGGWIRRFMFDGNDELLSVHNFASGLGGITWIGAGTDGCVWYIKYDQNELRRICYTLAVNLPPVAVATQNVSYGSGPLAVQFNGIASTDPENGALTYLWNFGDGQTSTSANPSHTFTSPVGVVTTRTVTLTVTDNINQSASVQLVVSVNNTPPTVNITSIPVNAFYPVGVDTTWTLEADVSDVEHGPAQLTYGWVTTLHHNTHSHTEPSDPAVVSSTLVSGVGCGHVETFYYEVSLTVTDAGGLATTQTRQLQPRCYAIPPTAMISASTSFGAGPLQVQLDGTMSYDPGTIVSYSWAFGDGTFSTSDAPFKIFTEEGDYVVTLTVTDDDGLTGQATKVISVISSVPPQCVGAAGSILREYFANIAGNNISDLVNSSNYSVSLTTVSYPTSFKVSSSTQSNFGTRLRGYIVPPTSGTYTFTSTSDDQSLVYLSPNADPQFKQVICSILGYTGETEYTKYASQTSAPIQLEAGRYYYVEMLQKEGSGGDHMALHWQTPNNSTRAVVPGSVLVRWQDCSPSVRVRMALQGPYDGGTGLMNDDLRIAGYIPTVEPYTALGYQMIGGSGNTVSPATLAVTGINAVVDWVLVELRSAAAPSVIVSTRTALLQRDGDVVGTDGYSRLIFNVVSNNYYVAVRHRNHLSVMTGASVTLNNALAVVDMTSTAQATYGTNAQKIFTNGKRGMWCGNVNSDNRLMYTGSSNDRDLILTRIGGIIPTNTVLGYYREDVNMNGNVRYTGSGNDRDLILLNIGGIVPTSVKMEQLP